MDAAALGRRPDAQCEPGSDPPAGEVRFELIKAGVPHRCTIDLATGVARFVRGGETLRDHETPIKGPGRYQIEFANVDDRLTLLVDGRPVDGPGVEYDRGEAPLVPTEADLSPVRIAVRKASVSVSDLVLKRDIYYTQTPGEIDYGMVFGRRFPGPRSSFSFPCRSFSFSQLFRDRLP